MNTRSNWSPVGSAGAYFLRPSGAERRLGRGGGHGRLGHDAHHGLPGRSETCARLRQRLRHRRRRFLRRICRRSVLTLLAKSDKVRGLCLVGSGPVGSGRARVVEFSYNHKNCALVRGSRPRRSQPGDSHGPQRVITVEVWGPIYKISYDFSLHSLKFVVRSTYDSDFQRAETSLRDVVSYLRTLF